MKNIELKEKLFIRLFMDNMINLRYLDDEMKTSICWGYDCVDCTNVNLCCEYNNSHKFDQEELEYILEKHPEARIVV